MKFVKGFSLPGILLTRLNENELQKLRDWLKAPNNQLIITPALTECNLKDFLIYL